MIDTWLQYGILLAQSSRLDGLRRFKERRIGGDDVLNGLLLLTAVTALILLLTYALNIQERRRNYSSPLRLFLELCKAHDLQWSERWLLWRVARSQGLRDPALLFIEPERFSPTQLGPSFRLRARQLKHLYARLYVGLAEGNRQRYDAQDVAQDDAATTPVAAAPDDQGHPFPLSLLQGK